MYVKNDSGQEECDEPEQLILFHSEMRDIVNDIISVINPEDMSHAYNDVSMFKKKNVLYKVCNNLSETLHNNLMTMITSFTEFYQLKQCLNNCTIAEREGTCLQNGSNLILPSHNRIVQEVTKKMYTQNRMQFKCKLEELVRKKEITVDCIMNDVEKLRQSNDLNLEKIRNYRSKVINIDSIYNACSNNL